MASKLFIFLILLSLNFRLVSAQDLEMLSNWEQALELAQKEQKQILIILTGSEWCAPCKKMDKRVIHQPAFQSYAQENLVIFLVDLPGGVLDLNSQVNQDYEKFKKKYETNTLPALVLARDNGEKIKYLKGKMSNLDNVLSQLKAE